ncbi:uncharacterized protein TNCV_3281651 [Trichonephila clavipes]|nr:uncharacterized protein TNCV_3281651 [Trichonephila clavipes]
MRRREDVETWMACDAEDCGFQILNEDEIVISMKEESDPVYDKPDEDEDNNKNESRKGSSNADAFSALETAMERYEQQLEFCPTQLLLLKRIRDLAAKKRSCIMLQQKMRGYFPQKSVQFHTLRGSHSVFGYPNNCVMERCPVPIYSENDVLM